MTVDESMKAGTIERPRGRKHVEAGRRKHRLAPGVIGLCLVMILASFVFVIVPSMASAARVQVASNQTSGNSTAANSTGPGPQLVQGTYVTLTCTHGTISLEGTQYCSHTSVTHDLCDVSSCQFSMTGTVDSGYSFTGWVLSGEDSVACGSCLSTDTYCLHAQLG